MKGLKAVAVLQNKLARYRNTKIQRPICVHHFRISEIFASITPFLYILIQLMKAHKRGRLTLCMLKLGTIAIFCNALFKDLKTDYLSVQYSIIYKQSICIPYARTHLKSSLGEILPYIPNCFGSCQFAWKCIKNIKAITRRNFQWWIECLPDAEWSERGPSNYECHCHGEGQLRRQTLILTSM